MIRDLEQTDADALARFLARNNQPEVTRNFQPFPLDENTSIRLSHEGGPDRYFIHCEDGVIQGFAMLRGWKEGYEIPSFGLLVDREAGGRGIGGALTAHAIEVARALGCPAIRLTVEPDNTVAVRLYERAGFSTKETRADGRLVMMLELR